MHMKRCKAGINVQALTKRGASAVPAVSEGDGSVGRPQKRIRLEIIEPELEPPAEDTPADLPSYEIAPLSPDPAIDLRRSTRTHRFPRRFEEFEATSYSPIITISPVREEIFEQRIDTPVEPTALTTPDMSIPSPNRSKPNKFRVFRIHSGNLPTPSPAQINSGYGVPDPLPHPFKNDSVFEFIKMHVLGPSPKSQEGMDEHARMIASGKLIPEELKGFSSKTQLRHLDKFAMNSGVAGGSFKTGSVKVKMPFTRTPKDHNSIETNAPEFEVSGIQYRSLIDIIVAKIQDSSQSAPFVHTPFTEWWCPPGSSTPIRIYGEAYSSDVAVRLHEKIKDKPPPEGSPHVENVVVLLKLGSDETLLANHGTASLWPIYVFFGNLPKDNSSKPSEYDVCHLAYLPELPDSFYDEYMKEFGIPPPQDVVTHCSRELYHAVIKLILEGKFAEAYKHGILIKFPDGITRRVFPRFYCYTADYPEKVLIATIKNLGLCPCPCCKVELTQVPDLGKPEDEQRRSDVRKPTRELVRAVKRARKKIFYGYKVSGKPIEREMGPWSRLPIMNAFTTCLPGLNVYRLLTVDLLHEVELGVWKALFAHIIRILSTHSTKSVTMLDERFRLISPFGGRIRRFANNASRMKKLAAHNFEDLLQCILPVFDGLLPEPHNSTILDLLFVMGCWHAYAKLRLHTEHTLKSFENLTADLGALVRHFAEKTCKEFRTTELPKERAARIRRNANTEPSSSATVRGSRHKEFNLYTYKWHALGHYPQTIREFGTIDNYNSQRVELEHRTSKAYYPKINKRNTERDIGKLHRRREVLQHLENSRSHSSEKVQPCKSPPKKRFKMSRDTKSGISLERFLRDPCSTSQDPATKDFVKDLKNYILRWTLHPDPEITSYDDFTEEQRGHVTIISDMLYKHKTLELTYTTYDMRTEHQTLFKSDSPDIMVLSDDNKHPYLYGRVLNFFHIKVTNSGPSSILPPKVQPILPVVWVRWFKPDNPQGPIGFHTLRYPSVSFYKSNNPDAFGFVHPDEIIRKVHLIPYFKFGRTTEYLSKPSKGRPESQEDWKHFNVNILVDRDMFMRYRGGGIGHLYMRNVEPWLDSTGWGTTWPGWLKDRDPSQSQGTSPQDNRHPTVPQERHEETELGSEDEEDIDDGNSDQGIEEQPGDDFDGEDLEHPEDDGSTDEDEDLSSSRIRTRSGTRVYRMAEGAAGEESEGGYGEESDVDERDFNGDTEESEGSEEEGDTL